MMYRTPIVVVAVAMFFILPNSPSGLQAQFVGGTGDGFSFELTAGEAELYKGTAGDGYAMSRGTTPAIMFSGLDGDGFTLASNSTSAIMFLGLDGDGFAASRYASTAVIFHGASADGFDLGEAQESAIMYFGDEGDGYALGTLTSFNSLFLGLQGDGFSKGLYSPETSLFTGGSSDGFAGGLRLYYHAWTGAVGTGWLVADNWTDGVIPTQDLRVRIPSGVPNMPAINAGVFKIGTGDLADYTCKALWVEEGAELLGRINAFIENHSIILIDGTLRWKNSAPTSFQNLPGAIISISSAGVLRSDL